MKSVASLIAVGLLSLPLTLMAKPAEVSSADARARHAQALDRAFAGDTKNAITILNKLADDSKVSVEEKDRVYLSIGRINYQDGYDEAALEAYNKVRRGSASWLESLEERAWVEIRSGNPEKAIATLKTVLSPLFKDKIQSEPYFTMSLAQLRVCDYPSLFKTLDSFKKNFRGKVQEWEGSTTPENRVRLTEASETVQKLNLVEAEAIQHLYLNESGKKLGGSVPRIEKGRDQMSFPDVDGDEVWLDEVDNYRVRVKGCPTSQSFADSKETKKEKSL